MVALADAPFCVSCFEFFHAKEPRITLETHADWEASIHTQCSGIVIKPQSTPIIGKKAEVVLVKDGCFDAQGVMNQEMWREVQQMLVEFCELGLFEARLSPHKIETFAEDLGEVHEGKPIVHAGIRIIAIDKHKLLGDIWLQPSHLRSWLSGFDMMFRDQENPLQRPAVKW